MQKYQRKHHRVPIRSQKQRELFKRRQQKLEGVPVMQLGKSEPAWQQIIIEDLRNQTIGKLKQLPWQIATNFAKKVVKGCLSLVSIHGHFMINQKMVFVNAEYDVFVWISSDLFENSVKLYLPGSPQGEASMVRSLNSYFKMWLKSDLSPLAQTKKLIDLFHKIDTLRQPSFQINIKAKSPEIRIKQQRPLGRLLMDNKSAKDFSRSPRGKQLQPGYFGSNMSQKGSFVPLKFQEKKQSNTIFPEKNNLKNDYQTKTFHNKINLNLSSGINTGSGYFPNKTTSGKHHIVKLVSEMDDSPDSYGKNNILTSEMPENNKIRKMKQSLDGIGEQINDLFLSNIENEQDVKANLALVQQQFSQLLQ